MQVIGKGDLIERLAQKENLSKAAVARLLNSFFTEVVNEVSKGNKVRIVGFGTWERVLRARKRGRNLITGETIEIPERKVPRFRPGKLFAKKVMAE